MGWLSEETDSTTGISLQIHSKITLCQECFDHYWKLTQSLSWNRRNYGVESINTFLSDEYIGRYLRFPEASFNLAQPPSAVIWLVKLVELGEVSVLNAAFNDSLLDGHRLIRHGSLRWSDQLVGAVMWSSVGNWKESIISSLSGSLSRKTGQHHRSSAVNIDQGNGCISASSSSASSGCDRDSGGCPSLADSPIDYLKYMRVPKPWTVGGSTKLCIGGTDPPLHFHFTIHIWDPHRRNRAVL
jgi:hypothetical protein